ncbi:MAG: methyltransferase [Alphaproteobacteria bacterium]|nr:methyltransferase [Alphaproteobacteria bacterium]
MHLFDEFVAFAPKGMLGFVHGHSRALLTDARAGIAWAVQPFKPEAEQLENNGIKIFTDFKSLFESGPLDRSLAAIFVALPKNIEEARVLLAQSLSLLPSGGVLAASAANDAGGKRIAGLFKELGLDQIQRISKRHARLVWAVCAAPYPTPPESIQKNAAGFWSQPGLFSWDRLDPGSALLMTFLPVDLQGRGADFGCGYGALCAHVLKQNPAIAALDCIDADARTLICCEKNLEGLSGSRRFLWRDLTQPQPDLNNRYDWIIMNPPFHEGKIEKNIIGQRFISVAAQSLKPGGRLYMVANTHLPYEAMLQSHFAEFQIIKKENGFKIIVAKNPLP